MCELRLWSQDIGHPCTPEVTGVRGAERERVTGQGVTDVGVNLKGTLSLSLRLLLSFSLAPGLNALGPGSICIPFAFGAFSRRFYPKRRTNKYICQTRNNQISLSVQ